MGAEAFVTATCTPCGVVVADLEAHALWHARIGDIVPLLKATVTTLNPETGAVIVAVRSVAEVAGVTTAETLRAHATTAHEANKAYLAVVTPTTAQAVAQVRALTQQIQALIRLAVRAL